MMVWKIIFLFQGARILRFQPFIFQGVSYLSNVQPVSTGDFRYGSIVPYSPMKKRLILHFIMEVEIPQTSIHPSIHLSGVNPLNQGSTPPKANIPIARFGGSSGRFGQSTLTCTPEIETSKPKISNFLKWK